MNNAILDSYHTGFVTQQDIDDEAFPQECLGCKYHMSLDMDGTLIELSESEYVPVGHGEEEVNMSRVYDSFVAAHYALLVICGEEEE